MRKEVKIFFIALYDMIAVALAWGLAMLLLQNNLSIALQDKYWYLILGVGLALLINTLLGLYEQVFLYASIHEALKILGASAIMALYYGVIAGVLPDPYNIDWVFLAAFIYLSLIIAIRFAYRFYKAIGIRKSEDVQNVMIVGMCRAGSLIIKEMKEDADKVTVPVCILDDNDKNLGQKVQGVPIVGLISELEENLEKYNVAQVFISQTVVAKRQISDIIKRCQKLGLKVKVIPDLSEIASGSVSVSDIKNVDVADLLGREQVKVNNEEILGFVKDKVVMVTGGGGSIGSELSRQIASNNPKELIIIDIYENNAYAIQQELKMHYPDLNLKVLIASVRDEFKVNSLFSALKPQIVFHAAAHKHVPFMEDSPNEAIKNNVHGTLNVATAAGKNNAEKFVLISTDKAVNPTNIMGATKRICEMIVQTLNNHYETDFVAVRFGNVLGSNGSVIPLFKKQIEEGGPVTVTDKEIVRYFMTIPEAVSLVLQAGANAHGGEIFVLDMGEPMNIYELALNMIRLSGLEPFVDIDIEITGLRPGEKLYEERLMDEEGLQKTANEMISVAKPIEVDEEELFNKIKELYKEARSECNQIKEIVSSLVPTYTVYREKNAN